MPFSALLAWVVYKERMGRWQLAGMAVAFAGVAKFPARVKCALLAWMAWKDATNQAGGGAALAAAASDPTAQEDPS